MKLLKFLIFALVALAVVGYFRGWLDVSLSGEDTFTVKLNKEKIEKDRKKAGEAVKGVAREVSERLKKLTADGEVKTVDSEGRSLTLTDADGKATTYVVPEDIEVLGAADTSFAALQPGARVRVTFDEENGRRIVRLLEVRP